MAGREFSDVRPGGKDQRGNHPIKENKPGKPKKNNPGFQQHPHHTGPKVQGPGEVPKA